MSVMQYHCPYCTNLFQVDASLAGQAVACPMCAGVVSLPAMSPEMGPTGLAPPSFAEAPPWPALGEPPPQFPPPFDAPSAPLQCPYCTGAFQIPPELVGQQVACPYCQMPVMAPGSPPRNDPSFAPPPSVPSSGSSGTILTGDDLTSPSIDMLEPARTSRAGPLQDTSRGADASSRSDETARKSDNTTSQALKPRKSTTEGKSLPKRQFNQADSDVSSKQAPAEQAKTAPRIDHRQTASTPRSKEDLPSNTAHRWKDNEDDAAEEPVSARTKPKSRQDRKVDSLLPPNADSPKRVEPRDPDEAPIRIVKSSQELESLLPPRVSGRMPAMPGDERALPDAEDLLRLSVREDKGEYLVPTGDGFVKVHEPVKTVRDQGKERTLRRLTPEEKEARRSRRNMIMMAIGVALLLAMLLYLRPSR